MTTLDYDSRSLRAFCELLRSCDVIRGNRVEVLWGAQSTDFQPAVPTICVVPSSDSYTPGGPAHTYQTALPLKPGPAHRAQPNVELTTRALWTRAAGADLVMYAADPTNIEDLIEIVCSALHDLLSVRGNYDVTGGRHDSRGGYSDFSDTYHLSIAVKIPILHRQRRFTAEETELTEEPDAPQ